MKSGPRSRAFPSAPRGRATAAFIAAAIGATILSTALPLRGPAAADETAGSPVRPFRADSPWNKPLTADARFTPAPDFRGYHVGLTGWVPNGGNVALLTAQASDPLRNILYHPRAWEAVAAGSWSRHGNPPDVERLIRATAEDRFPFAGNVYSTQVPGRAWNTVPDGFPSGLGEAGNRPPRRTSSHVPKGAKPASDGDGHTAIFQPDGRVLELYAPIFLENGDIVCLMYGFTDARRGRGIGEENGRRASMIPNYAGVLRGSHLDGGIDHALALVVPAKLLAPAWVFPAFAFDTATSRYAGALPMGARLALPPDQDPDALALETPLGKILARTARSHGFIVVDQGGDGISLVTEDASKRPEFTAWNADVEKDLLTIFSLLKIVAPP